MKKILIILFNIFLFAQIACAIDYFAMGKDAFAKKDYENANTYFVKALTANPNDATGRYYYAQTLTYLRNYKQAKIEYGYVIQLAPNTLAAKYSQQSIDYLNTLETTQGTEKKEIPNDNYITKAISDTGDLETWNKDKMPIKIYFDNSLRVKNDYVVEAKNALTAWETASSGLVKFQVVTSANQADVKVTFKGMDPAPAGKKDTLGFATPQVKDGYIEKCDITLYTIDPKYRHLTNADVYNVALHEYGHMLGIAGHSENQNDALYPATEILSNQAKQSLTNRDVNTLNALYSIDKNPYGTGTNSINRVLGSKEDRLNTTLQNNLDYIKQLPNNSNGYYGVARVYKELGKDEDAIQYYKKAIEADPKNTGALNNLANIYADKKDIKNAELYYKKAIQIDPKNIQYNKNLIILYMGNNRTSNARSALSALLYRNYKAREDADIKKFMEQLNK